MEAVRCVGRDIDGLACLGHEMFVSKGELDLAVEDGEHLLEVVAVGRRAAARWDVHVDQRVAPSGIRAGH